MSAKEFGQAFLKSLVLFSILFLGLGVYYNVKVARRQGSLTACKSNLKNIGSALEMYSTDWYGFYPRNLSILTPTYLKTLPICPATESCQYYLTSGPRAPFNEEKFEMFYLLECAGANHLPISVPANYPKYAATVGFIER